MDQCNDQYLNVRAQEIDPAETCTSATIQRIKILRANILSTLSNRQRIL